MKYTKDEAWLLAEKYGGVPTAAFAEDCTRLSTGEPLAYIIGSVPFLSTTIYLDSRPLIPRPETEYWTEGVIDDVREVSPLRVLDLCAGSGCIGIAIKKAIPHATLDLIESNVAHHPTIEKNIAQNLPSDSSVRVLGGDLFLCVNGETYDLIVSNPPYIGTDYVDETDTSVLAYEPEDALFAGSDGLAVISRIIDDAPRHLRPGGSLYIEHEPRHSDDIEKLAKGIYTHVETKKDQYGIARVTHLTR